jgi:hypothetical protein
LDSEELPLLKQAEGYRSRVPRGQLTAAAQQAVSSTTEALQSKLPEVLPVLAAADTVETPSQEPPPQPT